MLGTHHQLTGMIFLLKLCFWVETLEFEFQFATKNAICRCVGQVRKLAAGGGHSAVLTDACSLKDLCEFRLAESVTLENAAQIEDVAFQTSSDALVRLCEKLR